MPSLVGKLTGDLARQFTKICRAAGIDQKVQHGANGRAFALRSFHSLRHSFESHLANANVSPEMRRGLGGRASEAVQKRYTHLELATMRTELGKLPGLPEVA